MTPRPNLRVVAPEPEQPRLRYPVKHRKVIEGYHDWPFRFVSESDVG